MTYSTLSAPALAQYLAAHYALNEVVELNFINRGLNDTYLVTAGDGEKHIFRVYRSHWRSRTDIAYEIDALAHLHDKGVAVSQALRRRDGDRLCTFEAPEGVRCAVLFSFAPGRMPAYDKDGEAMAALYGRSVAKIHNATDSFSTSHQRFPLDLEHLIGVPLRHVEPVMAHRPADWVYLQGLADKLRAALESVPLGSLEYGFCHGDLNGWNAHESDSGALTFFDFDCCGPGWRAYDIAVFRWLARVFEKEEERWAAFLKGYKEVREIGQVDIDATSLFVGARAIWLLGLHAGNARDWSSGWINEAYLDRAMKFLRSWEGDTLAG
ncbi:MAG: phosphotransferase [Burkholderiales bacterium]